MEEANPPIFGGFPRVRLIVNARVAVYTFRCEPCLFQLWRHGFFVAMPTKDTTDTSHPNT